MIRKPRAAPAWRGAFLRALAEGKGIAHAAREAGIDVSSVHAARRRDPAFAAAWADAREKGVVTLADGPPALAPDEVVRGSADGRMRIVRAGPGRWSQAKEELFLQTLAATANISAACRAVGVSNVAVYARRERWPGFAARWDAALAQGWHGLDALMLESATVTMGGGAVVETEEANGPFAAPMTVDQAITVWKMHRAAVTGEGRRSRHDWRRETTMGDVRAELLKRIKAVRK